MDAPDYKARMCWPQGGRFLQTDPIGYIDDMNHYAYVGNDRLIGRILRVYIDLATAQTRATKDMDKTANKLEAMAGKLNDGKADSMMLAAKNLRGGAASLRSQTRVTNKKTIAEANADGRTAGVGAWVPNSNPNVVNVVMDNKKAWGTHPKNNTDTYSNAGIPRTAQSILGRVQ